MFTMRYTNVDDTQKLISAFTYYKNTATKNMNFQDFPYYLLTTSSVFDIPS